MLLVYVPQMTNRIGYTMNVLLKRLLRIDFSITTDRDDFILYKDNKFSYGTAAVGNEIFFKADQLLFNTRIEPQEPRARCEQGQWILFPTEDEHSALSFDPFAAAFFMLSRYEEYLPYEADKHGRYSAKESVAYRYGFLKEPVVEQWARILYRAIYGKEYFGEGYTYDLTVDIDAAWCYRHKGVLSNIGGLCRDIFYKRDFPAVSKRLAVLSHKRPDPFDTYDYFIQKKQQYRGLHLYFFALMADYGGYNRPVSYLNKAFQSLLKQLGDYAKMGLHPGYESMEKPSNIDIEKGRLQQITHRDIRRSRFHYLRYTLPLSYRALIRANIEHDYSMGYADTDGFRAGISSPYPFFDLMQNCELPLTIHPFCVMDTALRYGQHLSARQAKEVYCEYVDRVREVGGTMSMLVHNQNLSEQDGWQGWRESLDAVIEYATKE